MWCNDIYGSLFPPQDKKYKKIIVTFYLIILSFFLQFQDIDLNCEIKICNYLFYFLFCGKK